jgi:hypothetical protein
MAGASTTWPQWDTSVGGVYIRFVQAQIILQHTLWHSDAQCKAPVPQAQLLCTSVFSASRRAHSKNVSSVS